MATIRYYGTADMNLDCKILFVSSHVGARSLVEHTKLIYESNLDLPLLRRIVYLTEDVSTYPKIDSQTYSAFTSSSSVVESRLTEAEAKVSATDVLNMQFTSGTTGAPKAAMLTHR